VDQSAEWILLSRLSGRFDANLRAAQLHRPEIATFVRDFRADLYMLLCENDSLTIGQPNANGEIIKRPVLASPAESRRAMKQLETERAMMPLMVLGVDLGWLWTFAYDVPHTRPEIPGHRIPLYLIERSAEQLAIAMHLQDWTDLFVDPRVQMYVGDDAIERLANTMVRTPSIVWPRSTIVVDHLAWPTSDAIKSIDDLRNFAMAECDKELKAIAAQRAVLPTKIPTDRPLRVMGLTTLFSTFLQHSMRDWLASFQALGHTTHVLTEPVPHVINTNIDQQRAIDVFQPDLMLFIDHYRDEYKKLPDDLHSVCWVQDRMLHLFSTAAGQRQGPRDYAIGYARSELTSRYGWPGERFMSCVVPVNHIRFDTSNLSAADLAPHVCDLAFVSHASKTPEEIRDDEIAAAILPGVKRVVGALSERLMSIYATGGSISGDGPITALVKRTLVELGTAYDDVTPLIDYVRLRLNNALFRHQVLHWASELADERGLDFRLYGRGWEKHPTLSRFARGEADNQTALASIYRATRVNLQTNPHTSAHQRSFESLCAGGFVLMRRTNRDLFDPIHQAVLRRADELNLQDDAQLRASRDEELMRLIDASARVVGTHPLDHGQDFLGSLRDQDHAGWTEAGSTLWPDEFAESSFNNRDEFRTQAVRALTEPAWRASVVEKMRSVVIEKCTYQAVTQRLLNVLHDRRG